jgi:hypothetical protein
MKLNIIERILLSQMLPTEGSFTNLKLLRIAKENLSFTEEENKLLNFQNNDKGMLTWNQDVIIDIETGNIIDRTKTKKNGKYKLSPIVVPKDINLGDVVLSLITKAMEKLDKEEKLTENHMSIYEQLIETTI